MDASTGTSTIWSTVLRHFDQSQPPSLRYSHMTGLLARSLVAQSVSSSKRPDSQPGVLGMPPKTLPGAR